MFMVKSFKEIVDEIKCLDKDTIYLSEETFEEFLMKRKQHEKGKNPKLKNILEKAKKLKKII